ncbi:CidA/LrgA family protein [Curvibacter sp. RS43]|jgi:holin-like protein|uniref:CidA/LrgA family protein n=1 Tax=Curvibacter microcysteis TaxID=3026419 RepID=A0ABT5MC35_9BURK|nr:MULTISPECIES: CidA/LrgA family protein [unclassified Curvibacter]MDD0811417.1 CidA/LrgA family protein [Curvibacter sp. RS43]MDD0813482.1 CidA/LrgA family protein [Curvibacter sp. HBC28]
MIHGLATLFLLQLLGEALVFALHLPVPGPLLGMVLLAAFLVWRGHVPEGLGQAAGGLLQNLMLLFIPAVTGVMMHWGRVAQEWQPFLVACVAGVAITLLVTAFTLRWLLRRSGTALDEELA